MKRSIEDLILYSKKFPEIEKIFYDKKNNIIFLVFTDTEENQTKIKQTCKNFQKFEEQTKCKIECIFSGFEDLIMENKESQNQNQISEIYHKDELFKLTSIFNSNKNKHKHKQIFIDKNKLDITSKTFLPFFGKAMIEMGNQDHKSAKILFKNKMYSHTVFLSQQAIEKFLKGKLAILGKKVFKNHNLVNLSEILENDFPKIKNFYNQMNELGNFYLLTRYPPFGTSSRSGKPIKIKKDQAEFSLDLCKNIEKILFKNSNITI